MDKIYRLKGIVNDKLEHLGHVVGKYEREFRVNEKSGEVTKILKNRCVRCGAPVVIIDKPNKRYTEEMSGPALRIFCKKGAIPIEEFKRENVFAPNNRKDYEKMKEERLARVQKKYKI